MKLLNFIVETLLVWPNRNDNSPKSSVGRVVGFNLVQANTGTIVAANVTNGTVIYLDGAEPDFTMVALTSTGTVPIRAVQFNWNGKINHRTDRVAPYTLCGRNYARCNQLREGYHSITAMSVNNMLPLNINFQISAQSGTVPTPSPVGAPVNQPIPDPVPPPVSSPTTLSPPVSRPTTLSPTSVQDTLFPTSRNTFEPTINGTSGGSAPPVPPQSPTTFAPTKGPSNSPLAAPIVVPTKRPTAPVGMTTKRPTATKAPAAMTTTKQPTSSPTKKPTSAPSLSPVKPPVAAPPSASLPAILINCGGEQYIDSRGRTWVADSYFIGGSTLAKSNFNISNTADDPLYNTERYGPSTYSIPVVTGRYNVIIHFAEIYFRRAGKRVFDISVEGIRMDDIDIVQLGGGVAFKAVTRTIPSTTVMDGFLTIQLLENSPKIDTPMIAAIEIYRLESFGIPIVTPAPRAIAAPQVPLASPVALVPIVADKAPVAPVVPKASPTAPQVSPVVPVAPQASPVPPKASPTAPQASPVAPPKASPTAPQASPVPPVVPKASPSAPTAPQSPPFTPVAPQSSPIAPLAPAPKAPITVPVAQTQSPVTKAPVSKAPVTKAPVSKAPATKVPASKAPATKAPVSKSPTTKAPVSKAPVSQAPVSKAPVSKAPVTKAPVSKAPVTKAPVSKAPATNAPVSKAPVTKAPVSKAPATKAPASKAPVTKAPVTKAPVSKAPVTKAPVRVPTKAPVIAPVQSTPGFEPILINCAGGAHTDLQRRVWIADEYFSGGNVFGTGANILGTEDDELYKTMRWGQYNYNIPVVSGTYYVVLHFAEIYFTTTGQRVFDMDIEGTRLEDIDAVALSNGVGFTVAMKDATVVVTDGVLTIKLLDNDPLKNFPMISALEVHRIADAPPVPAPAHPPTLAPTPFNSILISCGGVDYTDAQGRVWMADKYYNGGNAYFNAKKEISGTSEDTLYQGERWGVFKYDIPIPEGDYEVVLHFAEIYYGKVGDRIFDIVVEDKEIVDLDIVQFGGGVANKAITREVPVSVLDGTLSLQFNANDPQKGEPKVSAIEVRRVGAHYSHAVTGGPYYVVDSDNDGSQLVTVDASESHTHGPGQVLNKFTWKKGKQVLGMGETTSFILPVGVHEITLTVVDSSGDLNMDMTTVTVKPNGFPEITSISPDSGDIVGGTEVTITGNALASAKSVKFGLVTITDLTIVDSKTIVVVVPTTLFGIPVQVSVNTAVGASNSMTYTYINSAPIAFNMKKVLDINNPSAVAFGPDGKLYVGTTNGQLARYTLNDKFDTVLSSVITTIDPVRGIHGIAFDPLETAELGTNNINVYISTSDIFHGEYRNSFGNAVNGKIQTVKGANLDIITNIVTGLPVSELDHAVNGIYFGDYGELYIAIGSNTNGGIPGELSGSRLMRENYFSAAIVVANIGAPQFNGYITYDKQIDGDPITGYGPNGVEVFAAGLRNPFGVVLHSNGNIYATENGPNPGFGDMATGCGVGQQIPDEYEMDELNIIKRGGYYGHPNFKRAVNDPRQCVWRAGSLPSSNQHTGPLMKLDSSTDGIIEFQSDHFNGQLRGNLILSKYTDGLFRVILSDDGESVNPNSNPAIPLLGDNGLAVTQAPDGSMVDARLGSNNCFSYQPIEPASTVMDIKSVFPRRGSTAGGTKLSIYGVNFDADTGPILIQVGDNACTNPIRVSPTKLQCTLPPSTTLGLHDVVVTIGSFNDVFVKGYKYILGRPV